MKIIKQILARDAVIDISKEEGNYLVELREYARGGSHVMLCTPDLKKAKHYAENLVGCFGGLD
jgi:hypothetical protein